MRWFISLWVLSLTVRVECSWNTHGSGQYHIQTDEGPERYFRFQTDNGQFRKEKRLQDGTVIGTEAWIDAAGFLRHKDYIADKDGYRILKSKVVFVGQGRQIEDAIKSTKPIPAQSGELVDGRNGLETIVYASKVKGSTYAYTTTTPLIPTLAPKASHGKLNYLTPTEAARLNPKPYLGFDHYPDELAQTPSNHLNAEGVYVRPHSQPTDVGDVDNAVALYGVSTTARAAIAAPPALSLDMQPPFASAHRRIRPIAVVATTPTPIAFNEVTPSSTYKSYSTPRPFVVVPSPSPKTQSEASSRYKYAPGAFDGLDTELLPPLLPSHPHRRVSVHQTPLQGNALDGNYELPVDSYNGYGGTRNGFRYVLPRQYHEEAQVNERQRAGSYGYVDPFGIRRVVYYRASPELGFVHRNNNNYVGLRAPPYDPPPPPPSPASPAQT